MDPVGGRDLIRVLVADSSRIYTQLLADALQRDPHLNVVASPQPEDTERFLRKSNIHVAVVSSRFEGGSLRGLDLLRQFRQISPQSRPVVLLDSPHREATVGAFRAGARGVFSRDESLDRLCECVRQVHLGKIWASAQQVSYAIEALASAPNVRAVDANGVDLLSKRELEVVRSVSEGLTNKEIAERLELSQHTIKNYLFRIFDKLGVSNRMELLSFAVAKPGEVNYKSENKTKPLAAELPGYSYELRMAEIHAEGRGVTQNFSTSYMWYLLADHFTSILREQVDAGKRRLAEFMTTEQILEAQRAAKDRIVEQESKTGKSRLAHPIQPNIEELPLSR